MYFWLLSHNLIFKSHDRNFLTFFFFNYDFLYNGFDILSHNSDFIS